MRQPPYKPIRMPLVYPIGDMSVVMDTITNTETDTLLTKLSKVPLNKLEDKPFQTMMCAVCLALLVGNAAMVAIHSEHIDVLKAAIVQCIG